MSLTDFTGVFGEARAWDDAIWPRFLEYSLGLIVKGYSVLLERAQWTYHWHEPQFTSALQFCMFELNEQSSPRLPIEVHHERPIIDPDRILAGLDHPISAPRVEIVLRHIGMPVRTYLACEGKMLTSRTIGNRSPKESIDFYVKEGMRRFVDGEYSSNVRVGIMIGFVLIGPVATIVGRIAETVVVEKLPVVVNLKPALSPVCSGHYFSEHPRVGTSEIRLEHLLFQLPLPADS